MNNTSLPTVKLSKQAGHILTHLTWLPKEVLEIIDRFPYHSARVFAAGMDYALNRNNYYTSLDGNDPIHFLSCSGYGYTLNVNEFVGVIPTRAVGLLLSIGKIAEQSLMDNQDLKKVLGPANQSVRAALDQYAGLKNEFPNLRKTKFYSYFGEPSIGERVHVLLKSIDAGASNLAGLKECYLVANYYKRAYNRANLPDGHFEKRIDNLDYELPSFPDLVEIKAGDELMLERPGIPSEKEWPDVLLRDGKYSIVHHRYEWESHVISTPGTSNFDDIRMAESNVGEMALIFLCKRNGKWGAVYSDGLRYFFTQIVPFIYDTPEDAAREVNAFVDRDNDTKWRSWDNFKGIHPDLCSSRDN